MPSIFAASACVRPRFLIMRAICSVSLAFISSWSGLGSPRSAKTLPLPCTALISTFPFVAISDLPPFVVLFRSRESLTDKRNLRFRRGDSRFRLLLKGMQHIHHVAEQIGRE